MKPRRRVSSSLMNISVNPFNIFSICVDFASLFLYLSNLTEDYLTIYVSIVTFRITESFSIHFPNCVLSYTWLPSIHDAVVTHELMIPRSRIRTSCGAHVVSLSKSFISILLFSNQV